MLEEEFKNNCLHLKTLLTQIVACKSVDEENPTLLGPFNLTVSETSQSMTAQGWIVEIGMWHHLLFTKLDKETQKAWERKNPGSEV